MIEIIHNLYIGDISERNDLISQDNWIVLSCCKNPCYVDLVKKKKVKVDKNSLDYKFVSLENEMCLNLVDMPFYDSEFLMHHVEMINYALTFIDNGLLNDKKVFVHCNKGESRSPSVVLLYLLKKGFINVDNFEDGEDIFKNEYYKMYKPGENIRNVCKYMFEN